MTLEEILAALQAIIDGAVSDTGEPRDLTEEEASRYEDLERQLAVSRRSAELRARQQAYTTPVPIAGAAPVAATAAQGNHAEERAFDQFLRTGRANDGLIQSRAQGEGIPSAGGYLVPTEFRRKLIERLKAYGGIANVAEEFTTGSGAPIEWPTVDDTANVGEIVAEHGTFTSGADVVFGTANLGAYKYMSGGAGNNPIRVSVELLQDAAFDVQDLLTRLLGQRIARIQAAHLATGTGVGQPLGLVTGLTGVQTAANDAITYADLVNMIHSVDPEYRKNARWVMNDASLAKLQMLTDSHGDPIWRGWGADMAQGVQEDRLLGFPVTIDQAMPTFTNNSPTINWGAFGDIRAGYVVRRVKDVQIVVDPYTRAAYGQVQYTAWARMDATQQDTNAYVALTGKS